jgi:hypothetical protein
MALGHNVRPGLAVDERDADQEDKKQDCAVEEAEGSHVEVREVL